MLGVTIGTKSYESMAIRATETFTATCNLPAIILNEEDMIRCGIGHPNWLKFFIFDLVKDDDIVFFDADTITALDYRPQIFSNYPSVVAVRDLPHSSSDRDGRLLGYPSNACLNGGWFIVNRHHHKEFLIQCRRAARHYHSLIYPLGDNNHLIDTSKIYWDQPIMNLVLHRMDLPIHFVDRRYNYIGYGFGDLWKRQADIAVRHFVTPLRSVYNDHLAIAPTLQTDSWNVDEQSFVEYSTSWRHFYDGVAQCDITLRRDGTIVGWPFLHYWFVSKTGDLVISDYSNVNFWMNYDGSTWSTSDQRLTLKRIA